tara:strand:- start:111 stop:911 length:801 start_codon:yes stop_codon:yes gene_type:complete
MKTQSVLPKFLQPKKINTLKRIGGNNDGGYVIDKKNISNSDVLIGLGMSDNWSFEESFNSINSVPTYIYDETVSLKKFLKKCTKYIIRINKPKIFLHWLKTSYNYIKFFQGNKFHCKTLVGIDLPPDYISLSTILEKLKIEKFSHVYLKIDIEGWEYRLLQDLILNSEIIEGLVIEFHDIDLHLDKIEEFIKKFPLSLVHTHCNNYSPLNNNNMPLGIECTFSCEPASNLLATNLPNIFDMPNNPLVEEYTLSFSDTASEFKIKGG